MTINGTSGNDTLNGTSFSDTIIAGAGDDSVVAGGGNDVVYGQAGNDTLFGELGNDIVIGDTGNDYIDGGAGADNLTGGQGSDTIIGGTELDTIIGDGQWYDLNTMASAGTGTLTSVTVTNSADGPIELYYINSTGGSELVTTIAVGGSYTFSGHTGDNYYLAEPVSWLYLDTFTVSSGLTFDYGTEPLGDYLDAGAGDDYVHGQYGDDTIYFGDGNDSVYGGYGNDLIDDVSGSALQGLNRIEGGAGNDTIRAGGGNDTVYGGADNDLIYGESANDSIFGDAGSDTIYGGSGIDVLFGGADADTFVFEDGFGSDSVWGDSLAGTTSDTDTLDFSNLTSSISVTFTASEDGTATDGTNTVTFDNIEAIIGTSSNDTINASADSSGLVLDGGGGADSILGGSGNDTIYGGLGNDTILSGAGNDLIAGGAGNDSITTGTGFDTIVLADGGGLDIIADFDMTPNGALTADQLDVSGLHDALANPVNAWDVVVTDDGAGNAVLTFPGGESITLLGVTTAQVDSAPELHAMGIPCIAAGTQVSTPRGPVPVERLAAGDLVNARDGPPLPVLWAGKRDVSAAAMRADRRLLPVEIKAGALGNARALRLSALHGVWVPEGLRGSLARAGHLARTGWGGARIMGGMARHDEGVSYHHLLLPRHALILVEGLWVESFWPGKQGFDSLDLPQRQEVIRALPRLAQVLWGSVSAEQVYGPPARPFLKRCQIDRATCAKWSFGAGEAALFDGFMTEPAAPKAYRYKLPFGS